MRGTRRRAADTIAKAGIRRGALTKYVLGFAEIDEGNMSLVGPKASSLVRLARARLPVPPGFCITTAAYVEHVQRQGLPALVSQLSLCKPEARHELLWRIRETVVEGELQETLRSQIERAFVPFSKNPVAVRSSAACEDLPEYSFAGQHGTFYVEGLEDCLLHVKHCWASLWSEHAYDYRLRNGLAEPAAEMAVIVQRLIQADASGVLFTVDPVSGDAVRLVLESCFGLGEGLVSGKVSPDRYVLDRRSLSILERTVSRKQTAVVYEPDPKDRESRLSQERAKMSSIGPKDAGRIARLGLEAEEIFGSPQDVEWAMAGTRLFLLQSRRITAIARKQAEVTVWSNANAGEVMPDVASPMTWSFVKPLVTAVFDTVFSSVGLDLGDNDVVGLVAGRAYFNVNVLAAAIQRVPGLSGRDITELLGGSRMPEGVVVTGANIRGITQSSVQMLLRLPAFMLWALRHSPSRAPRYIEWVRRQVDASEEIDLGSLSEAELSRRLTAFASSFDSLSDAIGFALIGIIHFGNLSALCKKWLSEDGETVNRLLAGLGGMASAEAGLDLWRLAAVASEDEETRKVLSDGSSFEAARQRLEKSRAGLVFLEKWDSFMKSHGHHARGELDVTTPRWAEQPDYVLNLVAGYLAEIDGVDPVRVHEAKAAEREEAERQCLQTLSPLKRPLFHWVMRQAQEGSKARENVKSEAVRLLATIRALLLELGARLRARNVLERPDDIFFLRLEELEPVRLGHAGFQVAETVAERRREYDRNVLLAPPPIVVGEYDPDAPPTSTYSAGRALLGLAASAGVAMGRARVILRTDEEQHVLPGEILVAPFTDPGWTPYFMPAAAIVMDMGGMLSHGSIVARECGIPAVVNVGSATKTIRTGQMIRVDGNRGEVSVLDR